MLAKRVIEKGADADSVTRLPSEQVPQELERGAGLFARGLDHAVDRARHRLRRPFG